MCGSKGNITIFLCYVPISSFNGTALVDSLAFAFWMPGLSISPELPWLADLHILVQAVCTLLSPPSLQGASLGAHLQNWVNFLFLLFLPQCHSLPSIWATAYGLHFFYHLMAGSSRGWNVSTSTEP